MRALPGSVASSGRWIVVALVTCVSPVTAQIDPSAGWRTLHTPHFRIHFRPAARAAALIESQEAERAYALLASELATPRGTVDIVLSDDADAANGAATPFPTNRIYIFLPPPTGNPEIASFDRWLRLATVHELTHIFHLDRARALWGSLQRVLGRAPILFPNAFQPSWMVEGLAVYYESKFTNAGRLNGSFHTELLASEAAAERARTPWNALYFTRWPGGRISYANGSHFLRFLADSLGDSVVPRLAEQTSGQLIPFRIGGPLAQVTHGGFSLNDAWPHGTRPAADTNPAGASQSVALDHGLWSLPVPRVSPDGKRVVYMRDDGKGDPQLRIVTLDGWREVREHRLNGDVSYDWLGDTLIVSQADWTSRWQMRNDLYRWLPDGRWERLTHGARIREPRAGAGQLSSIVVVPGANRPTLFGNDAPSDPTVSWGAVVPSPDGRWVAATRSAAGHWSLVRWPAGAPGELDVLVASRGDLSDPAWTPDGDLLYVSDQTGYPQIYRWRDGDSSEALTAEPFGAHAPAPLPDGSLLYAALGTSQWEVRRARPAPMAPRRPVAAPLPLDSAPFVTGRETGYALGSSLLPHFWIPVGLDRGPAGNFFGAFTGGTDAVGRYVYVADVLASSPPFRVIGDFNAVSYLFRNPSIDLSASSNWSSFSSGVDTISENDLDAALGFTFMTQRWRSLASIRLAAEYEGTHFICTGCATYDLFGGSVSLALRSYVSSALAISPEDGFQAAVLYRRREEMGTSSRYSNETRASLAGYLHIPGLGGFAHHVLAAHVGLGVLSGSLPKFFTVGGVATGTVSLGYGQAIASEDDFPVRGYAESELVGTRALTASLEYRIPVALIGQSLGHLPVGVDKLSLALFGDTGGAWYADTDPELTTLVSVGLELVGDLNVIYDVPLRVRLGVAQPLTAPPSGRAQEPAFYATFSISF